jgi:hypothetical protein
VNEPWLDWRWEVGATGETVFEHTRASLRDPRFGMRAYRDDPVTSRPRAPNMNALMSGAGIAGPCLAFDVRERCGSTFGHAPARAFDLAVGARPRLGMKPPAGGP